MVMVTALVMCTLNTSLSRQLNKFDGLMQKRRNSSALALELRFFCIKPAKYHVCIFQMNYHVAFECKSKIFVN